ncbi:MAG: hypothetical protein HQL32_09820 [Planctomycetes bacterium]|nr:hypothetical protein [Planctomycetota bacterium]
MATKKKPFDSLIEIADHYDQIRATNSNKTEQQILEIVARATGQSLTQIKKKWKLIQGVDWPVLDYLDRGVIGMNRAMAMVEAGLEMDEGTELMGKSLDDNISDTAFKEYLARYMERKEA